MRGSFYLTEKKSPLADTKAVDKLNSKCFVFRDFYMVLFILLRCSVILTAVYDSAKYFCQQVNSFLILCRNSEKQNEDDPKIENPVGCHF